ncbi:hypothetical protein [Nostoc favosum]|uniref:Uncharacterized protein n=1 Tax=Nostoc favosum CHAB5714 TaxID=2780399 RepID=A0ABS8II81_9NOSO|nr:hypothetical protein [Nostoc favosum]MCC5603217.1 hypothetical protein [Nostoc favosum CHAB5714]
MNLDGLALQIQNMRKCVALLQRQSEQQNTQIVKNLTTFFPNFAYAQSWSEGVAFLTHDSSHRQIRDCGGSLLVELDK